MWRKETEKVAEKKEKRSCDGEFQLEFPTSHISEGEPVVLRPKSYNPSLLLEMTRILKSYSGSNEAPESVFSRFSKIKESDNERKEITPDIIAKAKKLTIQVNNMYY